VSVPDTITYREGLAEGVSVRFGHYHLPGRARRRALVSVLDTITCSEGLERDMRFKCVFRISVNMLLNIHKLMQTSEKILGGPVFSRYVRFYFSSSSNVS
jgi:hypothetical protein